MRLAIRTATLLLVVSIIQAGAYAADNNLFTAVAERNLPALAALVERGADVNARNAAGLTPLMVAAKQGRSEKLIELLVLLGADFRARDPSGMTALMHAAANGEQDNAEQLLQMGIDPDIRDNSGKTVSDYAKIGRLTDDLGNKPSFLSMLLG